MHGNLIGARELYNSLDQIVRRDIGAVHGADRETFAEFRIGEAFRFERRIRADERVHGEDVIRRAAFGGQAFRKRARADEADFFARGPDEGDVAVLERA